MSKLGLRSSLVSLPVFCPDATRGVIKGCSSHDIKNVGIEGLVVNTYHLLVGLGIEVLNEVGGIKSFMNWDGFVISDSGGWQIFSLIQKNANLGYIDDDGVVFVSNYKGSNVKYRITPEECIRIQFAINSDIMICLDHFTPQNPSLYDLELSVRHTVDWAARCKEEFDKLCKQKKFGQNNKPLLFCVLQGGRNRKWVEKCAEGLRELDFDGWGLGGWLFDENKNLDLDICRFYLSCMEKEKPKYALGVGDPRSVSDLALMGFDIFDCVLPTRDARHKRMYAFKKSPQNIKFEVDKNWYYTYQINKSKYEKDLLPLDEFCSCYTCQNYSRAYIRYLFDIKDTLAYRLATIHNLSFYQQLFNSLRANRY